MHRSLRASAASCDIATLQSVTTGPAIQTAAAAAGASCTGGVVGWAYASNPGICTHGRCCGDANHDGIGDCEGICAFGSNGVTRTCESTAQDYSRICPCAIVLSPSAPPPPYVTSPPPPVPLPPLANGAWILADEGTSCTQECRVSGGVCDENRLRAVTTEAAILAAAAAAGVSCNGGAVGWSYPANPAICTHGRCCGDADNNGIGDCEGICAFGSNAQTTCDTTMPTTHDYVHAIRRIHGRHRRRPCLPAARRARQRRNAHGLRAIANVTRPTPKEPAAR